MRFPYFNENGRIESNIAYDTVEKRWRHLNFFQHECYLIARVPRIKNKAGKIQTYTPDWSGLCNQFAKDMPVSRIGNLLRVSDKSIWTVLDNYVTQA